MSTIGKALTLLDVVSRLDRDTGLTDLARLSALDKATARRLLVELEKHGFVEQDGETRKYRLGAAPVRLARIRQARFPFVAVAAPFVKALADAVGETVHLSEFSGGRLATIHVEDSTQAHRVIVDVGAALPFHATASGLAFLAFLPQGEIDEALARPLARFSPQTVTDADALRDLLGQTVERGFSICRQGFEMGVISAAAPIVAPNGRPAGALAVAAPIARADTAKMLDIGAKAATAARGIAEKYYGTSADGG
ncbi:IclR family transcriptional regulator [Shinella zoogloeoides]|uniref:IclR family transcriptional regulator n=1 Tax=Shinella zoogloeoides TaxID=352475 RepID=UPI00273E4DF9|nr:IclR family transcriptional regulator [Shinella zoogloeoides]WLR92023.1 IclR family transcriptional regulator [Shinella zoogloeoides]